MPKRTTEDVAKYFRDNGCELLDEYCGATTKMNYRCQCGKLSSISWNNFTKGKRCGCGSKFRHRYSIEEICKIMAQYGCECLEKQYKSCATPMRYKCLCGKIRKKSFKHFLHYGKRCPECAAKIQSGINHCKYMPYNDVFDFFTKNKCQLLTTSWEENNTVSNIKLQYICKCGRQAEITWGNFREGKRCGYCHPRGRVKKYTQQEMEKFFKDADCELLDQYVNSGTKVKFKCSCGAIDYVRWNNFRLGHRCHKCRIAKMIGPNHFAWRTDRKQMVMDKKFRSALMRIVRRCYKALNSKKDGHSYQLLGYTPQQLQDRIKQHPNWSLVKDKNWHIDHIFPIQSFLDYNIKDLKLINCLDNLRPILENENCSKHDTYNQNDFELWLKLKGIKL